jgi:hypothetical protein
VKKADIIDPEIPPIASSDHAHTYRSDDPFSKSRRAYVTISALTTTLKNAELNETTDNSTVTTTGFVSSLHTNTHKTIHYDSPFTIIYDLLLDPNIEKLSAISPYIILKHQGKLIIELKNYASLG